MQVQGLRPIEGRLGDAPGTRLLLLTARIAAMTGFLSRSWSSLATAIVLLVIGVCTARSAEFDVFSLEAAGYASV
jgi:hypothetical protein